MRATPDYSTVVRLKVIAFRDIPNFTGRFITMLMERQRYEQEDLLLKIDSPEKWETAVRIADAVRIATFNHDRNYEYDWVNLLEDLVTLAVRNEWYQSIFENIDRLPFSGLQGLIYNQLPAPFLLALYPTIQLSNSRDENPIISAVIQRKEMDLAVELLKTDGSSREKKRIIEALDDQHLSQAIQVYQEQSDSDDMMNNAFLERISQSQDSHLLAKGLMLLRNKKLPEFWENRLIHKMVSRLGQEQLQSFIEMMSRASDYSGQMQSPLFQSALKIENNALTWKVLGLPMEKDIDPQDVPLFEQLTAAQVLQIGRQSRNRRTGPNFEAALMNRAKELNVSAAEIMAILPNFGTSKAWQTGLQLLEEEQILRFLDSSKSAMVEKAKNAVHAKNWAKVLIQKCGPQIKTSEGARLVLEAAGEFWPGQESNDLIQLLEESDFKTVMAEVTFYTSDHGDDLSSVVKKAEDLGLTGQSVWPLIELFASSVSPQKAAVLLDKPTLIRYMGLLDFKVSKERLRPLLQRAIQLKFSPADWLALIKRVPPEGLVFCVPHLSRDDLEDAVEKVQERLNASTFASSSAYISKLTNEVIKRFVREQADGKAFQRLHNLITIESAKMACLPFLSGRNLAAAIEFYGSQHSPTRHYINSVLDLIKDKKLPDQEVVAAALIDGKNIYLEKPQKGTVIRLLSPEDLKTQLEKMLAQEEVNEVESVIIKQNISANNLTVDDLVEYANRCKSPKIAAQFIPYIGDLVHLVLMGMNYKLHIETNDWKEDLDFERALIGEARKKDAVASILDKIVSSEGQQAAVNQMFKVEVESKLKELPRWGSTPVQKALRKMLKARLKELNNTVL